jgi:hypothetical protein
MNADAPRPICIYETLRGRPKQAGTEQDEKFRLSKTIDLRSLVLNEFECKTRDNLIQTISIYLSTFGGLERATESSVPCICLGETRDKSLVVSKFVIHFERTQEESYKMFESKKAVDDFLEAVYPAFARGSKETVLLGKFKNAEVLFACDSDLKGLASVAVATLDLQPWRNSDDGSVGLIRKKLFLRKRLPILSQEIYNVLFKDPDGVQLFQRLMNKMVNHNKARKVLSVFWLHMHPEDFAAAFKSFDGVEEHILEIQLQSRHVLQTLVISKIHWRAARDLEAYLFGRKEQHQ